MSWVVQPQPAELRIGADHEPAGNETGLAAAFRVTREQERVGLARTGYGTGDLYDRVLAVERIEAAATAASLLFPFTLTARAECYLVGHPNPFAESVARATFYREAGADCLYVPGIADAETIGRLVKEVGAPVNVVMGLAGTSMSVRQLEDFGVKRVSIGGSLARATFGLIRRAAAEIRDDGTFGYAEEQVPDAELCQLFAARQDPTAS